MVEKVWSTNQIETNWVPSSNIQSAAVGHIASSNIFVLKFRSTKGDHRSVIIKRWINKIVTQFSIFSYELITLQFTVIFQHMFFWSLVLFCMTLTFRFERFIRNLLHCKLYNWATHSLHSLTTRHNK